jgi:hypothetical protein
MYNLILFYQKIFPDFQFFNSKTRIIFKGRTEVKMKKNCLIFLRTAKIQPLCNTNQIFIDLNSQKKVKNYQQILKESYGQKAGAKISK